MLKLHNWIDGRPQAPAEGRHLDVFEPATGKVFAHCPASTATDVESAVQAASRASMGWANTRPEDRAGCLMRLADLIEAELDALAELESQDNGKPVALARELDIPRAVSNLRFFAAAVTQWPSEAHLTSTETLNVTLRQPIGVVGCISPWNLPLYLFTWKIAPALAAGNTVVAKPSEVTPRTATMLAALAAEIGFPDGVLNVVNGRGPTVGEAIVQHPGTKAISFTGSSAVGRRIAGITGPMLKKTSLELGGKNATLVFADSDWRAHLDTEASIELGRGTGDEVAARVRRFLRTLVQVSSRYERRTNAVESADLRYENGYAIRLRGVSTVVADSLKK